MDIFTIDLTPNDIKSGQYNLKTRSYYLKTRQYDPKSVKNNPKRPQKIPISTCPLSISPYLLVIKTKDVGRI